MSLQNSQMWCRNSQAAMVKGEPDIVRIGGSDPRILRSINADGINLLATVGINLWVISYKELLMKIIFQMMAMKVNCILYII